MTNSDISHDETAHCKVCKGTQILAFSGIIKIYLWPCKFSALLILAGIIGWIFYSKGFIIMLAAGVALPLAFADMRLYLFPFLTIASMTGVKLNCPACNPDGGIFRER